MGSIDFIVINPVNLSLWTLSGPILAEEALSVSISSTLQ